MVADESRTDKTICLAVSPALKSFGICSRPRLFQVKQKVDDFNYQRKRQVGGHRLKGYSIDRKEVQANPVIGLDYVVARPRMKYYEEISAQVYKIYLQYIQRRHKMTSNQWQDNFCVSYSPPYRTYVCFLQIII